MFLSTTFDSDIRACLPNLRAFARSLTCDNEWGDDLVQDTVLRAASAASQAIPEANFKAWVFAILRNLYFNEPHGDCAFVRPFEAAAADNRAIPPAQQPELTFDNFRCAFDMLPALQREALVLIGAEGFRYEEAARICGCPIDTIRTRVARARSDIKKMLGIDGCHLPATEQGIVRVEYASDSRAAKPKNFYVRAPKGVRAMARHPGRYWKSVVYS
jgi:RNA polymerase sigma-70 factor (ECF subfamily)